MTEVQKSENFNSLISSGSIRSNMKNSNLYFKLKNSSSVKNTLPSVKEDKEANFTSSDGDASRLMKDPKLKRRKILNDYEQPVSGRESWWRSTIRETPLPGRYNLPTFLHDTLRKPNTYRFKSDGRKVDPTPQIGKGDYLLPGAYSFEDFAQRLKKLNVTYGFKNHVAVDKAKLGIEPSSNLSPFTYDTTKYLTIDVPTEPIKHSMFKSREKREVFPPKDGVPPGEYDPTILDPKKEISSCFKSETGRFVKSETIGPGPGAYEPISTWINSKQSQNFSTKGVFFTPSSKVHT